MTDFIRITRGDNPYQREVQGKANEPITVAALLDRSRALVGARDLAYSLEEIFDRLERNAPRVAVIGGSPDHPAHVMDPRDDGARGGPRLAARRRALRVSTARCSATARPRSTSGCATRSSRATPMTEMIVNQMEAQSYHGAFVIQGCDKHAAGGRRALAQLDTLRGGAARRRSSPRSRRPTSSRAAPSRRGADELGEFSPPSAEAAGHRAIADDLRDAMGYILQCSSNTAFQGVFIRAIDAGVLTPRAAQGIRARAGGQHLRRQGRHLRLQRHRQFVAPSGRGDGPGSPGGRAADRAADDQEQVNAAVDALFGSSTTPITASPRSCSKNMENAVRMHSASGGSTNLLMHLVGAAIYAGYRFSIWDLERIHHATRSRTSSTTSLTPGARRSSRWRTVLLRPDSRDGDARLRVDPQRRPDGPRRPDRDRLDLAERLSPTRPTSAPTASETTRSS